MPTVRVSDTPRPKGSLICRGPRSCPKCGTTIVHPVTADDNADSRAWRDKLALAGTKVRHQLGFTYEGPVAIDATFVLPRPAAAAKRWFPHHRPDVDKLARMLLDALQDAHLFDNDGQVVDLHLRKRYPGPATLPEPGVTFTIRLAEDPTSPALIGLP